MVTRVIRKQTKFIIMGIVCRVKPGLILLKELLLKKFTAKITAKFPIYAVMAKTLSSSTASRFSQFFT